MNEEMIAIFGSLFVAPIAIVVMVIYLRRYSNMEKMKAIESGANLGDLKFKSETGKFVTLRFALLMIGMGFGFLFGTILDKAFHFDEVGYFACLFIFGGAGLFAAYLIEEKKSKEKEEGISKD
ncbi:MAG: hypothetical protein OEX02_18910 [Cyclobacteriaceae bacterium]|nr:hypothetical protein [Cyclobacteriaceae bacterium]